MTQKTFLLQICLCLLLTVLSMATEDLPELDNGLDLPRNNPIAPGTAPGKPDQPMTAQAMLSKGTTLKLLPLPAELASAEFACLPGTLFGPEQQYSGELPVAKETLIEPRTGIFFVAPQIVFVLYKSSDKATEFDRLLIDTNGDGNLGDEKVIARPAGKEQITLSKINLNGNPASMAFYFPQKPTQIGVPILGPRLCPPAMPQGTVHIGRVPVRVALFNGAPGMDYQMGNVVCFMDLNGDGKFNLQWDDPLSIEGFQLAPLMYAGKSFLQSAVSKDGLKLYLAAYAGKTGDVNIKMLPVAQKMAKLYVLSLLPDGGNSSDILRIITNTLPAATPLGKYALLDASVYGEENRMLLSFAYPDFTLTTKGMAFPADRVEMKATAAIDGEMLQVSQKTSGPGEVLFNVVGPATEDDPGPFVEVFKNALMGKPVMTGNMEYG